ncbi:hypothetical protein PROFUN_02403 [Planoprotostelium fungivorum]|uniref:DDH domain-containing protein n=1 Tax=Planoprotostelium fungivorum TaxID=1890364 RepID=A0A2P6NUR1_9EUKA|nr:hypothetical protein PROFUN_02403 [Planoprotostelium fungivorum]
MPPKKNNSKRKNPPEKVQQSLKFFKVKEETSEESRLSDEGATICLVVPKHEGSCSEWPAPSIQMEEGRKFLMETVEGKHNVLIIPDKDADGLSSGAIALRSLVILGLPRDKIKIHFVSKGQSLHTKEEREKIEQGFPDVTRIIILDQGSRGGKEIVDPKEGKVKVLIVDHHHSKGEHPDHSQFVTAQNSYPIATSSLLTYMLVRDLHPQIPEKCDWLAVIGVYGDLSASVKWVDPWPDMTATIKRYGKTKMTEAVSLINAPRRTSQYDPETAWKAIVDAESPNQLLTSTDAESLREARQQVNAEIARWSRTPPVFNDEGTVALLRINSPCQIHPVIATRWSNSIKSKHLKMVMCSNSGYTEGSNGEKRVNFSCRIPKSIKDGDECPNLQDILVQYSDQLEGALYMRDHLMSDRLSREESRFRSWPQRSNSEDDFEQLVQVMRIGFKVEAKPKAPVNGGNTLDKLGFFKPKEEKKEEEKKEEENLCTK